MIIIKKSKYPVGPIVGAGSKRSMEIKLCNIMLQFSLSALTVVGGVSGVSLSNTPTTPTCGKGGVFDSEMPLTPPTTVKALRLVAITW